MKNIENQIMDYLEYCEKVRRMSERTLIMKRSVLWRFVFVTGLSRLELLTNPIMNNWIMAETTRGISARTMNMYNAVILAMVRYYRDSGMLEIPLKTTLIHKLKERTPRRIFYTRSEITKVSQMADTETQLMINIMADTGMRIAELTHLRLTNFNGRRIIFLAKGQKVREAYIRHNTYRLFSDFINENSIKDYLWVGRNTHLTTEAIRKRLKKAFATAGYQDFYPHALRHSFATNLQLCGATTEEIRILIGHASIVTTERYLHGFDGQVKKLFEKYS